MLIEAVACTVDDAVQAMQAGASRIELVSAISEGGLTPSPGALAALKHRCDIPVVAMLRPRGGGFVYSPGEFDTMIRDARILCDHGADGLVVGIVTDAGELDLPCLGRLTREFAEVAWVFHRAFDVVRDSLEAIDRLAELGFRRVLTSGHAATAKEGAWRLRELREHAAGRIDVMPGGGVRAANARLIANITGANWLHAGPFRPQTDPLTGAEHLSIDADALAELVRAVANG